MNHDDYDAADDMRRSVEFANARIRERVARGGRGWRGCPAADDGDAGATDDVPTFRLILRPLPRCTDAIKQLRLLLKRARRSHHFACLRCEEVRE
jgi:hypothetical protein